MHYKSDVIISEKVMHNATFAVQDKSLVITHADIPALSLTVGQRVSSARACRSQEFSDARPVAGCTQTKAGKKRDRSNLSVAR
jgi:hypothetical protein